MKRTSNPYGGARRQLVKLSTHLALFALLLSHAPPSLPRAAPVAQTSASQSAEVTAVVEDVPDLDRRVFRTQYGTLFLNLPKYITPDKKFSGTLFAEPAGRTAEERAENAGKLKFYAVEVMGQRVKADGKPFAMQAAPAKSDSTAQKPVQVKGFINIVIINTQKAMVVFSGQGPCTGTSPTRPGFPPLLPDPCPGPTWPPPPTTSAFSLPTYGQAGGFLVVRGPFDGEVADSDYVRVGGKPALTLAESPTSRVVLNMNDDAGNQRIEVSEQGHVVSGDYRELSVSLAVTKQTTRRGEQSMLTVLVGGLKGLGEDVPLVLENHSPAIVRMERGERETITIHPDDVRPDGTFTQTRMLTSLQQGAFHLTATVVAKGEGGTGKRL